MESITDKNKAESNWFVSFLVVCFVPLVACTPYLVMATAYKTPNPEVWLREDSSLTLLTAFIFTIFSFSYYFVRERKINTNVYIEGVIDLKEYQAKKYIDYLLAHYGNVCSIAAITAVTTLAFREAVKHIGVAVPTLFVSIGLVAIFLVYGLAFLKAVFGALNRGAIVFISLMGMLALDASLIKIAISSIPKDTPISSSPSCDELRKSLCSTVFSE